MWYFNLTYLIKLLLCLCIIQFRSSDRLVTDRDIRMKELERLYLEKQKIILEKQERILQSYKWV